MKHGRLCAIGHNVADSLASGLSFVIGYHPTDVFGEAAASPEGLLEVDFLRGQILRGNASENLSLAARRFAEKLPAFCTENEADVTDFEALSAVFETGTFRRRVLVTVKDRQKRESVTEYQGLPLKRVRMLDALGRIRRKPRLRVQAG